MVYVTRRYRCSKCHRGYPDCGDAEQCEMNHIVKESTDAFKEAFDEIMAGAKGRKGKAK